MSTKKNDPYLPHEAEIIERIQESPTIFTFRLKFTDSDFQQRYNFLPGQFNMVYFYGIGEVAISVVSDLENNLLYDHTIRAVGRATKGLEKLKKGDHIGVRGPFGRGWPLKHIKNKDVVIITGGLGCAPTVSIIHYIIQRREQFGAIKILQGVKHSDDFIFRKRYAEWEKTPNTEIFIAADRTGPGWSWLRGHVTDMIAPLKLNPESTIVMMCGPEIMMQVAATEFLKKRIAEENIYLSMERNMECAVGHCGHCQFGGLFICKDGPIFQYSELKGLLGKAGF